MINQDSIAQRVSNGAKLLDEKYFEWYRRIDFNYFHITSLDHCVLGQVFGEWGVGTEELGINYETYGNSEGARDAQEYFGFELTIDEYDPSVVAYVESLFEDAWAREVQARL